MFSQSDDVENWRACPARTYRAPFSAPLGRCAPRGRPFPEPRRQDVHDGSLMQTPARTLAQKTGDLHDLSRAVAKCFAFGFVLGSLKRFRLCYSIEPCKMRPWYHDIIWYQMISISLIKLDVQGHSAATQLCMTPALWEENVNPYSMIPAPQWTTCCLLGSNSQNK